MTPEDAEEYTQSLGQIGGGLWRQVLWAQRMGVPAALGLSLRDWVDKRLGGYVRMAVEERRQVVAQLTARSEEGGEGLTQAEAADVVGVGQATVSRDLDEAIHLHNAATSAAENPQASPSLFDGPAEDAIHLDNLPDPAADRSEEIQELARQAQPEPVTEPPPLPQQRFSCIVIDPPWPMPKIERKAHPWQGVSLDYPTMPITDIEKLPVSDLAEEASHIYLWVTHRFLPDGLRLLDSWGFRYQCLMTWAKPSGFTPYSWMYDSEHVLFGTRGGLKLLKRGLRLTFTEPVNGHSVKPEVFYDRVRAASPGPRLEMFARQERSGFVPWGNEAPAS